MLLTEWNWDDAKEVWYEEGMEKGLEKGLKQGTRQGKLQTAISLQKLGVSLKIISQATGLSVEEISAL